MTKPDYPVYIVSKGRWQQRHTARALEEMGVSYFIVVESSERDAYASVVGASRVLVLDAKYQHSYDTCDDIGGAKGTGPGPARNFAWDHAIDRGAEWHWVMDDNIYHFYRFNRNARVKVKDGAIFRAMESFCGRYENIAMAGPVYKFFVPQRTTRPPFTLNTRIYSCNLIRNDVPFRWRGRYNEDTDLSLRMLKAGWCTIQFIAFQQNKAGTQSVKGGNTAEFYEREGTLPKSRMQVALHPDVSKLVWRFNRWHHYVDYSVFKQGLRRKPGVAIQEGTNEFGMKFAARVSNA